MTKPEFVYTTYIKSTPEKVWAAITNPEFARQYWGGLENVSDWKRGSKWEHIARDEQDPVYVTGEVLESDPPKRLVLTWADPDRLDDVSRVTMEIEPIKEMVRLTVIHGEFKPGSIMAPKIESGWPRVLSSMKSFLETGQGLDIRGCKVPEAQSAEHVKAA
jgi:uncharacterized protein YndB with AHSA1/START domain